MRKLSELQIDGAYKYFTAALKEWSGYSVCERLESVERVREYFNDHLDELRMLDFTIMHKVLEDTRAEVDDNQKRYDLYFNAFLDYHIRTVFSDEKVIFAIPDETIEKPVIPQSQSFFGGDSIENNFNRASLPPADEFTDALKKMGKGKGMKCYILFHTPRNEDKWLVDLKDRLVNDLKEANIFATNSSALTQKYGTLALNTCRRELYTLDKFIILATPSLRQACGKFDDIFDEQLAACLTRIETIRKDSKKAEPLLPVILQGNCITAVPDMFVSLFTPQETVNARAVKEGYKGLLEKIIQHCFNDQTLTLDNVGKQLQY